MKHLRSILRCELGTHPGYAGVLQLTDILFGLTSQQDSAPDALPATQEAFVFPAPARRALKATPHLRRRQRARTHLAWAGKPSCMPAGEDRPGTPPPDGRIQSGALGIQARTHAREPAGRCRRALLRRHTLSLCRRFADNALRSFRIKGISRIVVTRGLHRPEV
jgi:hypothetical protein